VFHGIVGMVRAMCLYLVAVVFLLFFHWCAASGAQASWAQASFRHLQTLASFPTNPRSSIKYTVEFNSLSKFVTKGSLELKGKHCVLGPRHLCHSPRYTQDGSHSVIQYGILGSKVATVLLEQLVRFWSTNSAWMTPEQDCCESTPEFRHDGLSQAVSQALC
jgi:hypothetical protein